MKLHTKLILILITFLSCTLIASQLIQFGQITHKLSDLSEANLNLLTEREKTYSNNLYHSIAESVSDSLNRGEMDKFSMMLRRTKSVEGLEEFSLFDTEADTVTYSSDPSFMGKKLPSDVNTKIRAGEKKIFDIDDKYIQIYHAQEVVNDCIRCHTTWNLDYPHGGVLYFKFSAASLTQAKADSAAALQGFRSTYIFDSVLSLLAVIAIVTIAIFFLLRRMVAKPLGTIGVAIGSLAGGDLTVGTNIKSKDEIGTLSKDFNSFMMDS